MTYNPNDDIVKKLCPIIKEQTEGLPDQKYWEFVAVMAESGNPLDPRQVADKIIQSFPWPIGLLETICYTTIEYTCFTCA